MRVLVVMPGVGPEGGAEQSFAALAPELISRGVDLHLAVLTDYQTLVPSLERAGVVIHDLSRSTSIASRARAARQLVRRLQPTVVHATLWEATLPTQLALVGVKVPLLITWAVTPASEQGAEAAGARWKRRAVEVIDAVLGRLAGARYHAVTDGVASSMARALRVRPERVMVGERGRDLSVFDRPTDESAVREGLGLAEHQRLVLAVGRQDPQKGYVSLLRAFDEVADRREDAVLAIAGRRGAASADLERVIGELAHGDRVLLLGQRDDVPQLLNAAAVVVCASWREGAAGAVVEAMAAGAPVVAVDLLGLEGVLSDGDNARVVERSDLAAGIDQVLSDPALAARIGDGGRRTARERFTIERSAERMAQVYLWAADPAGLTSRSKSAAQRPATSAME